MFVVYGYVFENGSNYHKVQVYDKDSSWNKEQGLVGKVAHTFKNSRIAALIKNSKNHLSKEQIMKIKNVAQERISFALYDSTGKYLEGY